MILVFFVLSKAMRAVMELELSVTNLLLFEHQWNTCELAISFRRQDVINHCLESQVHTELLHTDCCGCTVRVGANVTGFIGCCIYSYVDRVLKKKNVCVIYLCLLLICYCLFSVYNFCVRKTFTFVPISSFLWSACFIHFVGLCAVEQYSMQVLTPYFTALHRFVVVVAH